MWLGDMSLPGVGPLGTQRSPRPLPSLRLSSHPAWTPACSGLGSVQSWWAGEGQESFRWGRGTRTREHGVAAGHGAEHGEPCRLQGAEPE